MFGWPKQNWEYREDTVKTAETENKVKTCQDTQTSRLEFSVKESPLESPMFHAACLLDHSATINSTWSHSMHE